jgi:hypothetical protein
MLPISAGDKPKNQGFLGRNLIYNAYKTCMDFY